MGPAFAKRAMEEYGLEKTNQFVQHAMDQIRAIKATVEKENLDCEFLVRRTFDVFWDEQQAQEVKTVLSEAAAAGSLWSKEVQWIEGPHLEKVRSF
jgi:hypothetical protein